MDRLDFELLARDDRDRAPAAGRAAEERRLELPLARARRTAQTGGDELLLEPGALAHGPLRDEPEVELERVGDDLAQRPDAHVDGGHGAAVGVLDDGVADSAGERELVHALTPVR